LLSKWPAPCDYAARANPEGAKLSFAFVFRRLKYQSILFQPHQKHTFLARLRVVCCTTPIVQIGEVCFWWSCAVLPRSPEYPL